MKKPFKKIITMALITAFASSVSFPALASEPTSLTTSQKLSIVAEYNDAYDVNLQYGNNSDAKNIASRNASTNNVMCEEEFRLHAELLAVKGNLAKPLSESDRAKFEEKYFSIIAELNEKYPSTTSVLPTGNNIDMLNDSNPNDTSSIAATQYSKTKTKNAAVIKITSTLTYVTTPVERFVSASNISWSQRSDYEDVYTSIEGNYLIDPYYDITLNGTVITITVDGLTAYSTEDPNLGLPLTPQFVTYQISEM